MPVRTYPTTAIHIFFRNGWSILSIRNTLEESSISLEKLLGVKVYSNRFEAVTQATCMNYDQYYGQKEAPEKNSEGSINVIGFDGIGVPVIKSEAAKLKARLGKGEKRQKKKEAMVGVSYHYSDTLIFKS